MSKTAKVVIEELYEDMPFSTLVIWADLFEVGHHENEWFDDEWPDRESELRQRVTEAAVKVLGERTTQPLVMIDFAEVELRCMASKEYQQRVLGKFPKVLTCKKCHKVMEPGDGDLCGRCRVTVAADAAKEANVDP